MADAWYYQHDGGRFGPISAGKLKELAGRGELRPNDLVQKEGMSKWVSAGKVKGLFASTPSNRQTLEVVAVEEAPQVLRLAEEKKSIPIWVWVASVTFGCL